MIFSKILSKIARRRERAYQAYLKETRPESILSNYKWGYMSGGKCSPSKELINFQYQNLSKEDFEKWLAGEFKNYLPILTACERERDNKHN